MGLNTKVYMIFIHSHGNTPSTECDSGEGVSLYLFKIRLAMAQMKQGLLADTRDSLKILEGVLRANVFDYIAADAELCRTRRIGWPSGVLGFDSLNRNPLHAVLCLFRKDAPR